MLDMNREVADGRAEGPLAASIKFLDEASLHYLAYLIEKMRQSNDWMFVYILASMSGTFYVGMTNNVRLRQKQHKEKMNDGFTKKYGCWRLVYFEIHTSPIEAIAREKQIKNWRREKKKRLIQSLNPPWIDLSVFLPVFDERNLES